MKPAPFVRGMLFALIRRRAFLCLARLNRPQAIKWIGFARSERQSLRLNAALAFQVSKP